MFSFSPPESRKRLRAFAEIVYRVIGLYILSRKWIQKEPKMSADCCGRDFKFEGLSPGYKRRLWLVITINAGMFLLEIIAGAVSGSQALQADALDFFADA